MIQTSKDRCQLLLILPAMLRAKIYLLSSGNLSLAAKIGVLN